MFNDFSKLEFTTTPDYGRYCSCGWEFRKKRKGFISIFLCKKHTEDLKSYLHEISEIITDALICEILHVPFSDSSLNKYLRFYLKNETVYKILGIESKFPYSLGHLLSPFGKHSLICPTKWKGTIGRCEEFYPIDNNYLPTW